MTTFASLDLSTRLLKTLAAEGYQTPTPIQAECIPPALAGRDLLGCAQTGTGKTAAFALPILDRLTAGGHKKGSKHAGRKARALILAPTRELAGQIEESLQAYGRHSGLRHAVIYGGVKQFRQVRQLQSGVDILVATPGRLLDLIEQGYVDLSGVQTFVLDEADRMLDMGFIDPIRQIGRKLPNEHQTLFFSATMAPKTRQLANAMLKNPVSVSITPAATAAPLIDQTLYHVPTPQKPALLSHLLEDERIARTVVFTKTKHGAEKLARNLSRSGVNAGAIHGNKSQAQRQRALDAFRAGRSRVLVATDVAARGLDVDGITHVFNYNLPNEAEAYIHRIGRTGRAGATGQAISFCSRDERGFLREIERLTGERIETTHLPAQLERPGDANANESRPQEDRPERPARKPRRQEGARPNAGPPRFANKGAGKKSGKPGAKRTRPKSGGPGGARPAAQGGAKGSQRQGKGAGRAPKRSQ
ncbi:MAG: DEAD/DEAH box helicase [Planctomycetota bacterium]